MTNSLNQKPLPERNAIIMQHDALSVYIPIDRRLALAQNSPLPHRTTGTVLFADISGFTSLTATLEQEMGSRRGAEELTRHLNHIYGSLIAQVHYYHGSVITFSGDAITCWFDDPTHNGRASNQLAVACALAMQQVMTQFQSLATPDGTIINFGIKVALTSGPARRFAVGHPSIQKIEVLAGTILDRVSLAERQIQQGEIIAGEEVIASLEQKVMVLEWRTLPNNESFALIGGLTQVVPQLPWSEVPLVDRAIAQNWLLPPVYQRLERGEGMYSAELRPAVTLFVKFSGIDYDTDNLAGNKLDAYMRWVQTELARYDGYLLQLTIGDKGSYFYATYGAPIAHEDDPLRAITVALLLQSLPSALDFIHDIKIGISQGQIHAGAYGSPMRRTYGILGNEVNVAARLMECAEKGQILVTSRVAEAINHLYELENIGMLPLKGSIQPIPVWAVGPKKQPHSLTADFQTRILPPLVGRTQEQALLKQHLQNLKQQQGGTIIIEGEAGIGKSRLAAYLQEEATAHHIRHLFGAGDAIEQATVYHAWRPIFRDILGLQEVDDATIIHEEIKSQLANDPDLYERIPLLNAILPLQVPDNHLTAQMTHEVRAINTRSFLARLLGQMTEQTPTLLILDDAHWLDSASWALLTEIRRQLPTLLLVIITRPMQENALNPAVPDEYKQLARLPDTTRIQLTTLSLDESLQLVCQQLNVTHLPEPVVQLIRHRAEGHPFFSEELAYALRDAELIHIQDGICTLAVPESDLQELDFPDTIQGVITSRIDRLDPAQQLTLKVASVIGRIFSLHTLRDVHPITTDHPHLPQYLADLVALDITPVETPEPELAYIFKHIITQEIAYSLLLFSTRKQLHQAVAEWYERNYSQDLSPFYPLLVHHWSKAEETSKTLHYLDKAGEQAQQRSAYKEAAQFFGQALTLQAEKAIQSQTTTNLETTYRRARWTWKLGEACYNLGKFTESNEHLQEAAALYGHPLPKTQWGLAASLINQLLKQLRHRLWPARFVSQEPATTPDKRLDTAQIYQTLSLLAYIAQDQIRSLYTAICMLNISESVGPSPVLAEAYGVMCIFTGIFKWHDTAQAYYNRAVQTAERINEPYTLARVMLVTGLYHINSGHWLKAQDDLQQAAAIFDRLGDKGGLNDVLLLLASLITYTQSIDEAARMYTKIATQGLNAGNDFHYLIGLISAGRMALIQGRLEKAQTKLEKALALLADNPNHEREIDTWAFLALVRLRQNEIESAWEAANTAFQLIEKSNVSASVGHVAFTATAEVYLTLWEAQPDLSSEKQNALIKSITKIGKALRTFMTPVGEANAWRCQGSHDWLAGKKSRAFKAWHKSLRVAEQLNMPYYSGQAHYEIGRHLPLQHPDREKHLTCACELFTLTAAHYDLQQAKAALAQTS